MEIFLTQLREVVNIIEEDESDGWEAWIKLKTWLAQYEAAQPGVQSDGAWFWVCHNCEQKNGKEYNVCWRCDQPRR
jgi:hypothetical protein